MTSRPPTCSSAPRTPRLGIQAQPQARKRKHPHQRWRLLALQSYRQALQQAGNYNRRRFRHRSFHSYSLRHGGYGQLHVYLPEDEENAQETKRRVEKHGRKCHLMSTNLKARKKCKTVVGNAVKAMGGVDILVNNATYQMMVNDIKDLSVSEYVSSLTSLISPFSTIRYKLVNVFQASPSYNNHKSTDNPPICRGQ
jgi:hypothetical protein